MISMQSSTFKTPFGCNKVLTKHEMFASFSTAEIAIAFLVYQSAMIFAPKSEISICSDDEYSVLSERSNIPSPISATSLAACMKVDSMFSSNLVPKLSIAATVNIIQFTVYNHMENIQNGKNPFQFVHNRFVFIHTIPYHATSHHTILYHTILHHTMPHHILHTTPYFSTLSILYNTILYHTTRHTTTH